MSSWSFIWTAVLCHDILTIYRIVNPLTTLAFTYYVFSHFHSLWVVNCCRNSQLKVNKMSRFYQMPKYNTIMYRKLFWWIIQFYIFYEHYLIYAMWHTRWVIYCNFHPFEVMSHWRDTTQNGWKADNFENEYAADDIWETFVQSLL